VVPAGEALGRRAVQTDEVVPQGLAHLFHPLDHVVEAQLPLFEQFGGVQHLGCHATAVQAGGGLSHAGVEFDVGH